MPKPSRTPGGKMQPVHPRDLKAGDQFVDRLEGRVVWVALHDAQPRGREIHVDVQFAVDGGCSTRVWDDDANIILSVHRP